jgi:hypothetical protein
MLGHIQANGVAMRPKFAVACALFAAASLSTADAAHGRHARQAQAPLTAERVNDAATTTKVAPRSSAAATLRAAILLDRAHFSPGEIDARYGSNLRESILGYQSANGLDASGIVDAATWKALDADSAPVLVDYTITDADVSGPFVSIPASMAEKAKLPALGYTSVLEELGERFHASRFRKPPRLSSARLRRLCRSSMQPARHTRNIPRQQAANTIRSRLARGRSRV